MLEEGGTMTTINVVDGTVTLFVTVSAEYTNQETEPILHTAPMCVERVHPLVRALVNDEGFIRWDRDPREDPLVARLQVRLEQALNGILMEADLGA
jgi:hypothetical protein